MSEKSVEEMVDELTAKGWLVSSIFQWPSSSWQCNLTRVENSVLRREQAMGDTMHEAVAKASIDANRDRTPHVVPAQAPMRRRSKPSVDACID